MSTMLSMRFAGGSAVLPFSILSLCLQPPRCSPPRCSAGDGGWRFTAIRGGVQPAGTELLALVEPFALPMWVGETRLVQSSAAPLDGVRLELLRSGMSSPLAHVPAIQAAGGTVVQRAYTGALATEAVCCQLSAEGALLVGTRRLRVATVASSRPQLRLRCEELRDAAADAAAVESARARAVGLWEEAIGLSRLVAERRLQRRLSTLGGPASRMVLSMTADDQAALLRGAAGGERGGGGGRRVRSARDFVDEGRSFAEEAARVRSLLSGAGSGAAPPAALESHIALRWASGGGEAAHAAASGAQRVVTGDTLSLPSGASSEALSLFATDEAGRWAEAARLIEEGVAAMRAEASLLTLGEDAAGGGGGES